MGQEISNYVIVGTKIPREVYEDQFGHPYMMDEKTDDLVAVWGGEKQWDEIVAGEIVEKMEGANRAKSPTDLISLYSSNKEAVKEKLEAFGITDRELSIYLVGSFL